MHGGHRSEQLAARSETLRKIVVDLAEQLDRSLTEQNKYQSLLRELLEAQRSRKSEQLSKEQLALFEAAWQARSAEGESAADEDNDDLDGDGDAGAGAKPDETPKQKRGGRQPLARHLKRERIVHDLAEAQKHCDCCGNDLRLIAEETSERYKYIPASMKVIQDVCLKYACACTVRTATKPPQPIEKSTAGASLLAQVIVAKWADHQPLHRQEKMFERHGIDISRKTMGGWMAQYADLLDPLYQLMKKEVLSSKVIGTDDTSVKVLDRKLSFARIGRIWPYVGDAHHPVIVYDYTPTRARAGPAKFLEGYKGYLQADAYSVYDAFFKPERGMTEVGCWMHARRYVFKALESDEPHMGPALHLIARLYAVEERAKALSLSAEQRLALRQRVSARLLGKLHQYLLELQPEVLPKSPSGAAVRYALNQWEALTGFLGDGELEIDNGATERAIRGVVQARYPGTGENSSGGYVTFDPKMYKDRPGLLLSNDVVYTMWSSHCDFRPYTGWVMGYSASTLKQLSVLNLTPNGSQGSIWGSGSAAAADAAGNLYWLMANGTFDTKLTPGGFPAKGDYGNSFLKVSTAGNQLRILDYFAMYNTVSESSSDLDLGSGGAILLPPLLNSQGQPVQLAAGGGKDRNIYIVDTQNMGKFSPSTNHIYQEMRGALTGEIYSQPAFFNNVLYIGAANDHLKAFTFANGKFFSSFTSQTITKFGYPGTTPSISSNGSQNVIVWTARNNPLAALHAYDGTDLSKELFSSSDAPNGRDNFGNGNKFIVPTVVNGKVYVGTTTGVGVFGLLP